MASTYGRGIWNYALAATQGYTNEVSNSPQTIFPTQTATFTGTLTAQNGYSSPVNLTCNGAAPLTCTLNPTQETPTATYTLAAGGNVSPKNYVFTAQAVGTDPLAITVNATVTLQVVDFNLTAPDPNSITVGQGDTSTASTFQVTAAGNFAGSVTLSCSSGLPPGATCLFSPSSMSPTSSTPVTVTLMVATSPGTPVVGPVTVTIAAVTAGAPAPKTQTFNLTVTRTIPDFTIALTPTPNATVVNQNVTWNGTLTAIHGYTGSVSLTCTAGAPGTCVIVPPTVAPVAGGTAFTVTLSSVSATAFTFAIQGTDGTLTHSTPTETLTVGTDVTWTNTGNTTVTVLAGQSATYSFSAAPLGGSAFTSTVSFGCANGPALTLCKFNPATIAPGAQTTSVTLTITTTGPNPGTQSRTRAMLRGAGGWLYGIFLLMGIVGLHRKRCGERRAGGAMAGICLALGLMANISCGGVTGSQSAPPPPVTVTVNPKSGTTLFAREAGNSWPPGVTQQQFTATVNGSTDQSVTWAVTGGNANGTVDANGLYSSPALVPNPSTLTVTATPAAGLPGSASATIMAATPLGRSQISVAATVLGGAANKDLVTLIVQ